MTTTNPVLKFALGTFNFLLPMAWISAFAFAAILSVMVFFSPINGLMIEIPLVIFVVVAGTYVMRHSAFEARSKAAEKIKLQEAAGADIEPDDREAATANIPSFGLLLKRNAIIALFYAPLVLLISAIAYGLLTGIMFLTSEIAENRAGASVMIRLLIPIPIFGWLYFVGISGGIVARFVDERILHVKIELPADEQTRQKERIRKMIQEGRPKTSRWGMFSGIIRSAAWLLTIVPPLFVVWFLNVETIDENLRLAIAVPSLLLYSIGMMILFPMWLLRRSKRKMIEAQQKAIEEAETPEEAAEIKQEIAAMDAFERVQKQSTESRVQNRMFIGFMGMMLGVVVLGILLGFGARALGADGETAKGVMTAGLCVGALAVLGGAGVILPRFMPKTSKAEELLIGYERALRTGDYTTLKTIVDAAVEQLPNWETQIPAAAAYAQMGKLEEAEQRARKVLEELSQSYSDEQREMRKPIMGHVFGFLAEIELMDGRLDAAEKSLARAREFGSEGYPIDNTTAKYHLYRNEPNVALKHVEAAEKAYRAAGQAPTMYNVALRAWALALQREFVQADKLMTQALKGTPTEHVTDLAEIYLIGSYVARAEGKDRVARVSLEKALSHDRYGVYGLVATREMGGG